MIQVDPTWIILDSGCSTVVERTLHGQEVMDSYPDGCLDFYKNLSILKSVSSTQFKGNTLDISF